MTWVDDITHAPTSTTVDMGSRLPGSGEARTGSLDPSDRPPAPPPPPPRKQATRPARQPLGQRLARVPLRYQLIVGGMVVVAATVIATRAFIRPVDEQAITQRATADAVSVMQNQIDTARAESTQIAVPSAFAWSPCPVGLEAQLMIGGDPRTAGKTLNPERAALVDRQATALLRGFKPEDMRLVSPSVGALRVAADDQTAGVALFDCAMVDDDQPAAPPTTVAVAAS